MTDWKQITARIRRARTSKDPAGQLSNLYQKTRDAMVAFELAKYFETSGRMPMLLMVFSGGGEISPRGLEDQSAGSGGAACGAPGEIPLEAGAPPAGEFALTPPPVSAQEPSLPFEQNPEALESSVAITSEVQQATDSSGNVPVSTESERKGRRRGRRGGRNRRKGGVGKAAVVAAGQQAVDRPRRDVDRLLRPSRNRLSRRLRG